MIALLLLLAAPELPARDATFVLLNGKTGEITRINGDRAKQPYPPCSTFKIPNSAIALETGVAPDAEFTLRYDPALKIDNEGWARDHSLRTAYRVSAVWYFQEIARRVGAERMSRLLRQLDYGNADISGGIDRFWLGSSLRISANQQVEFLRRLNEGGVGLKPRTTEQLREIMLADEGAGWKLRAKTGACRAPGEDASMWYVGWVEREGTTHYFALQMGGKEYEPLFSQRVPTARRLLKHYGVLP